MSVVSVPCPSCGGQLPEGVFSQTCPSCGQAVAIENCPSCDAKGLVIARQSRQRVAFCEECGWTKIEQGLGQKVSSEIMSPITCSSCGTENRQEANFCKECGKRLK